MGIAGCGPTCLSMVYSGLTGDASLNPLEMANFSNTNGYYISGQETSWNLMTEGAQALGLTVENGTVDAEYILANLTENTPMTCSMYPGDFTYTGHFIVLTGIDPEGKIMVNDPNSNINIEKHWPMEEIFPQIRNIWKYLIFLQIAFRCHPYKNFPDKSTGKQELLHNLFPAAFPILFPVPEPYTFHWYSIE